MASTEEDTTANYTDPSIAFSTTLDTSSSKLDITREELEKRQLLHKIELLKLELSQKILVIDALRNQQTTQVEELRDQLADVLHQRKMLHVKLKSTTHIHEQEVQHLKRLVHDLEQEREMERSGEGRREEGREEERVEDWKETIKSALYESPLSEEEYLSLRGKLGEVGEGDGVRHRQSLADYVRVRVYEITEPLKQTRLSLQETVKELRWQLTARETEIQSTHQAVSDLSGQLEREQSHTQQLATQLSQVRVHIRDGDYKIASFDQLARERDDFKTEVEQLRVNVSQLQNVLQSTNQDKTTAQREVLTLQQKTSLLLQDKEYLSHQVSELGERAVAAEGREETLAHKLSESHTARETLYQQCIHIREKERREGEEKLQRELERVREMARQDFEHTKSYTKELYDRENRTMMDSYHRLSEERDRALTAERETAQKYDQLLQDHHKLQSRVDSRLNELQTAVQVKTFECQQLQLEKEASKKQLKETRLLADTLQKKVDVLNEEVCRIRNDSRDTVRVLEERVRDQSERLSSYQQIETEMDDIILQAAQAESESDAERVLFSYGFGTNLPTTAKRRAQQSVRLARRVLQLEQINTTLRRDVDCEREQSKKIGEEVTDLRSVISEVGQPQSYLVQSLRRGQEESKKLRERLSASEKELEFVKEENKKLKKIKSQMSADLETLLSHRQELSKMRKLLLSLQSGSLSKSLPTHSVDIGDSGPVRLGSEIDENQLPPPSPVHFTKEESHSKHWYRNRNS